MIDVAEHSKIIKIIVISSVILLVLPAIFSMVFFNSVWFATYSVTVGDVSKSVSLGMSAYCSETNGPDNATNVTCSKIKLWYTLGQFKLLLSINLFF